MLRASNVTLISATAVVALLVVASGCAPRLRVDTHAEPDVDWSAFATYALVSSPDARTAVRDVLERKIAERMAEQGYRAVPSGTSDLLLVALTRTQPASRQVFGQSPGGCCVTEHYLAGTLEIDVFEARRAQRIWRGVASVDLHALSERQIEETTSRAVAAILAELPRRKDESATAEGR